MLEQYEGANEELRATNKGEFNSARTLTVSANSYVTGHPFIRWPYAAVVAACALRVAGSFGNPPDTASMQMLRASLSEDA